MIQRILFCIFTTIVLVSSQDGLSTVMVSLSSGIVAISSHNPVLQSSSAIQSSLIIASSSEHVGPTSVQSSAAVHKSTSSAVHKNASSAVHKSASSAVLSTIPAVLSTISLVMPSSPVGSVSSTAAKTPLLSSTIVSLTSSAAPLVSSTAPMRSSSVIITGIPVVTASPTAMPWPETIEIKNNGEICLKAELKAKFKISYKQKKKNGTFIARVPLDGKNLTFKGHCNETIANFSFTWNEHGKTSNMHTFSMQFENNITTNKTSWKVQNISAVFNTDDSAFTDAKNKSIMAASSRGLRKHDDNRTYFCNSKMDFKMESVTIIFEKIILQPFSNATNFTRNGQHCSADNNDDDDDDDNTVPIAVGAALGGLVLIVLVAYIIGRRRSNRGYEQV